MMWPFLEHSHHDPRMFPGIQLADHENEMKKTYKADGDLRSAPRHLIASGAVRKAI
jgi:hypothetical protein